MCVGAGQGNIEELASEDIGCAVEAAKESVLRCRETSIRSLGSSQSEFKQLDVFARRYTKPEHRDALIDFNFSANGHLAALVVMSEE